MKSAVEQIADAVLYEGYILYPYRPSSLKNRQRWNFGGICPRVYAEAQGGSEIWRSQTEVLAEWRPFSQVEVKLRFLHLVSRQVAQRTNPVRNIEECAESDLRIVPALSVGGRLFQTWQEAIEREVTLPLFSLESGEERPAVSHFYFPASHSREALRGDDGQVLAALLRTQQEINGSVRISRKRVRGSLFRLRIEVLNLTHLEPGAAIDREQAMTFSLASSHLVLSIREGEFVSLLDPPEGFAAEASECQNVGVYPVLVGQEGERSTMMASPVILYDYPKIAAESAGDLFDGTEIDEILTLRIMALTEEEKCEMRQSDERGRRILERIEADPEHLARLHGALREVAPGAPAKTQRGAADG